MRMNMSQVESALRGLCHNEIDQQIITAIMCAYAQISGFYEEHAFRALKLFQDKSMLILNVGELNRLA